MTLVQCTQTGYGSGFGNSPQHAKRGMAPLHGGYAHWAMKTLQATKTPRFWHQLSTSETLTFRGLSHPPSPQLRDGLAVQNTVGFALQIKAPGVEITLIPLSAHFGAHNPHHRLPAAWTGNLHENIPPRHSQPPLKSHASESLAEQFR